MRLRWTVMLAAGLFAATALTCEVGLSGGWPDPQPRPPADPPARPSSPPAANVPRFGIFRGAVSDELFAEFTAHRDVEGILIFYNWTFDPDLTGTVDLQRLTRFVEQTIPNPNFRGWVCFDAEHIYTDRINQPPIDSPQFAENLRQIEAGLKLIKSMRPGAKLTCWGWPLLSWQYRRAGTWVPWDKITPEEDKAVFERWKACRQVWRHFDWWTPSAYDRWPREHFHDWYQSMHKAAVVYRQKLCQRLNGDIPIITSIWPRSSGYPDKALHVIPCEELAEDQVRVALDNGASGVVWWGAPKWYYEKGRINAQEITPGLKWEQAKRHFDIQSRQMFLCLRAAVQKKAPESPK